MALPLISEVRASVRFQLQDNVATYRYADADIDAAINEALREVYRVRPDLFYGKVSYLTGFADRTASQDIQIPGIYKQALVDYATFAMERSEEEFSEDARAAAFLKLFASKL